MAATAYAFVVSLMNTMASIESHPRLSTCFDNHQFESLRKNLDSLLHFVENHSDDSVLDADESSQAEDLLSRIAVVAQLTEDLIEVEAADQIRDLSTTQKSQSFLLHLQRKIQEMDSIINEEVIKVKDKRLPLKHDLLPTSLSSISAPPAAATVKKSSMVGFDGYVAQLLDELNGYNSGRQILPIVGMGGVGKTTLARSVYENLLSVERFTLRVWITVSETFTVSDIFVQALSCLGVDVSTSGKHSRTDDEQGEELRKNLYGRRYLIVLDDMWSVEAWERIKFYFPENNKGSRIVVTTRQQQLVDYFASSAVAVDLLDDANSWELFCDNVFGQEQGSCPLELEESGQMIVRRCKGLPLAIIVIGGLLRKSPRTLQYWEKIANDKSKYSSGSDEGSKNNALSILYTSYTHLPVCLKSCFLYLGLFPEDHEIVGSQLVNFLVAEGFIKPNRHRSLEEVAESCIKELIDRNLVLVGSWGRLDKKVRSIYVHDVVRELMIRVAEKENFHCVQRDIAGTREFIVDETTASFYPPESLTSTWHWEEPISLYYPLQFCGQNGARFKSRLQRVVSHRVDACCEEVNLRMIYNIKCGPRGSISSDPSELLFSTLSLFWSLQTIIMDQEFIELPVEIWKLRQLRHIEIQQLRIPDPPPPTDEGVIVLHNLQTLKCVENLSLSKDVCKRIVNVKELEIVYDSNQRGDAAFCLHLHDLEKLERLQCFSQIEEPLPLNLKLPNSLKELSLGGPIVARDDLEMIALLPHLQILSLLINAVEGAEWNMGAEVEFMSLKHLLIRSVDDLVTWIADASNFPVLETLTLMNMNNLEEIPQGIGEIPTLERMMVSNCSESAVISAINILREQLSLGNEDFKLRLDFLGKAEAQMWREQIQESGITSQNLHISSRH